MKFRHRLDPVQVNMAVTIAADPDVIARLTRMEHKMGEVLDIAIQVRDRVVAKDAAQDALIAAQAAEIETLNGELAAAQANDALDAQTIEGLTADRDARQADIAEAKAVLDTIDAEPAPPTEPPADVPPADGTVEPPSFGGSV